MKVFFHLIIDKKSIVTKFAFMQKLRILNIYTRLLRQIDETEKCSPKWRTNISREKNKAEVFTKKKLRLDDGVFVFVVMEWSLLPNALRPFQI